MARSGCSSTASGSTTGQASPAPNRAAPGRCCASSRRGAPASTARPAKPDAASVGAGSGSRPPRGREAVDRGVAPVSNADARQRKGGASALFPSMASPRLLGRRRILGRGGALRRSVLLRTLVAGAAAAGAGASVPFAFGGLALTPGFGPRGRGFDRGLLDGGRRPGPG